jgi:hypothetical protein
MQGSDQCYGQTQLAAAEDDQRGMFRRALIFIYGGILRFSRAGGNPILSWKSTAVFSKKVMLEQRDEMMIRPQVIGL